MTSTTVSPQATLSIKNAFDRFESTVTTDDKRLFSDTSLKDVRDEALRIEGQLRARRTQRNLARLEPFLRGLEHYSKVVEVLCNGTPYLPWIWAPVKLMLMVTMDSLAAFDKLIEAYQKIADIFPRADRLGSALKGDHNVQSVLALVYSDILEFHRRAYKFVRQRSWALCFSSLWAGFESRFSKILQSLAYHTELLDKEAAAADISEAVKHHREQSEHWEQQEREWLAVKVRTVLTWLDVNSALNQNTLEKHREACLPGSCDWFFQNKNVQTWMKNGTQDSILWLWGKPGAGKSMICANLIEHAKSQSLDVFYFFCSYLAGSDKGSSRILRTLASQIILAHQHLAPFVHDAFFQSHPVPSRKTLLDLLPELLKSLDSAHLIIDGLDEWDVAEQKDVLKDLHQLHLIDPSLCLVKILLSSQNVLEVARSMQKRKKKVATISLDSKMEEGLLNKSIERFIEARLQDIPDHFIDLDPDASILAEIRQNLIMKCKGMFLWVRLVLDSLESVYSPGELRKIVQDLPIDLDALYLEILNRICMPSRLDHYGGVARIFSWLCYARRPLHKHELLQGLVADRIFDRCGIENVPIPQLLDHCKPFIEERSDSTIAFVHFSIKEFFLKSTAPRVVSALYSQQDISMSCVHTLINGLQLLQPDLIPHHHYHRIAEGTFRFLPYALEFWLEHCLIHADQTRSLQTLRPLSDLIERLHHKHEQNLSVVTSTRGFPPLVEDDDVIDSRLVYFRGHTAYNLIRNVLNARLAASQSECANGADIEAFLIQHDSTLFSKLGTEFNKAVITLLAQTEVEHVSKSKLKIFQSSYGSTAFRCRYANCLANSGGFASAELRKQHEASHNKRLHCQVVGCQHRIGFKSKSQLNKHMRDLHADKPAILVPPRLRNSSAITGSDEEQDLPFMKTLRWVVPHDLRHNLPIHHFSSLIDVSKIITHLGLSANQIQQHLARADQKIQKLGRLQRLDSLPYPVRILSPQVRMILPQNVISWVQLTDWLSAALGLQYGKQTMRTIYNIQQILHEDPSNLSLESSNSQLQQMKMSAAEILRLTPAQQAQVKAQLLKAQETSNSKAQQRSMFSPNEIEVRMNDPARMRQFKQLVDDVEKNLPTRQPVQIPDQTRAQVQKALKDQLGNLKKVDQTLRTFHASYDTNNSELTLRQIITARALVFQQINEVDGTMNAQITITTEDFRKYMRIMIQFVQKITERMSQSQEPQPGGAQQQQGQEANAPQLNAAI